MGGVVNSIFRTLSASNRPRCFDRESSAAVFEWNLTRMPSVGHLRYLGDSRCAAATCEVAGVR